MFIISDRPFEETFENAQVETDQLPPRSSYQRESDQISGGGFVW